MIVQTLIEARKLGCVVLMIATLILSRPASGENTKFVGESLIFEGATASNMLFTEVIPETFRLRSTYLPNLEETIEYERGRDFILDAEAGVVTRTPASRIPDYRENMLYGQIDFDHSKFPGFGNTLFFAFADYESRAVRPICAPSDQGALLPKTKASLTRGGPFKVLAYGDSITTGGDATRMELRFTQRYAGYLREQYPLADITLENGATGGDSTRSGLARLEEKVLTRAPDLVLIGFGMNDHNVNGVPIEDFRENLHTMIGRIREHTAAEVLLFSAFPPNPDWKFGSDRMAEYAEATKEVAEEVGCAYADVFDAWVKVLERKGRHSLLGNNINHPNDFGHWIYFEVLKSVQF